MTITGPGFFRQRDGGKAEVVAVSRGRAVAWLDNGRDDGGLCTWTNNGEFIKGSEHKYDLIAPWSDPEPIPAGVWYCREHVAFFPSHLCDAAFRDRWFPRRAEFPQSPPVTATPWCAADVPWPVLLKWNDKACHPLALINDKGIIFVDQGHIDFARLHRDYQWSPDNVRWFPCTREAVAAWRAGGEK